MLPVFISEVILYKYLYIIFVLHVCILFCVIRVIYLFMCVYMLYAGEQSTGNMPVEGL